MNITCPSCAKQFRVPEGAIGDEGRTVRCSGCAHTWHQMPEAKAPEVEASEAAPEITPEASEDEAGGPETAPDVDADAGADAGSGEETGVAPDGDQGDEGASEAGDGAADGTEGDEGAGDDPGEAAADEAGEKKESTRDRLTAIRRGTGGATADEAGGEGGKRRRPGVLLGWVALVAVVGGTLAGGVLLRQQVLDALPTEARLQAAAIYDAVGLGFHLPGYGLEIELDEPSRGDENGRPVLVISGRVVNASGRSRQVPPLHGVLLDETGQPLQSFDVDPGVDVLPDGEVVEFRQVIASPDEAARELNVDFAGEEPERADDPAAEPMADPAGDPATEDD